MLNNEIFEKIVSERAPCGYTWGEWEEIAELSQSVDWGCDWRGAVCAQMRSIQGWSPGKKPVQRDHEWHESSRGFEERGCCADCAMNYAYLREIPPEALEFVQKEFDEKYGFWAQQGCKLPWKWRSVCCLKHHCLEHNNPAWAAFILLFCHNAGANSQFVRLGEVREGLKTLGIIKDNEI